VHTPSISNSEFTKSRAILNLIEIGWVPAAYLCDDAQKLAAILDERFPDRFSPAESGGVELGVRRGGAGSAAMRRQAYSTSRIGTPRPCSAAQSDRPIMSNAYYSSQENPRTCQFLFFYKELLLRVCSVSEPDGTEWNQVVPRGDSCVRFWDGTKPTRSSKANILCRSGTSPSGRFGRTKWNGLCHRLIAVFPAYLSPLDIPSLSSTGRRPWR
jgi:hypothetical protein